MEAVSARVAEGYNQHYITFKELMEEFDRTRALWIQENGTDKGFSEWFDGQIGIDRAKAAKRAHDYIAQVRNPVKRQYAKEYAEHLQRPGVAPDPPRPAGLSLMASQGVEMELAELLTGDE